MLVLIMKENGTLYNYPGANIKIPQMEKSSYTRF